MISISNPARIIFADNYSYFRDGFKTALKKQKEGKLVAEASNGHDLLRKVETHQPDIVITDVDLPELDGIEAARIIKRHTPNIGVIALVGQGNTTTIQKALKAGINTCLQKNTPIREVMAAIKTISRGGSYTSPILSEYFTNIFKIKSGSGIQLSSRELNVIRLMCQQYTSREIAGQLFLSERTVEDHRKNIQRKIQARNMAGIIVYAVKNELVEL